MFHWTDLEAFTHLFNCVNGIAGTEKAHDLEFMRQFLAQPACRPEQDCYLVESSDSLVGFALLAPELPIGRTVASGGVLESHRRQGIGRMLVRRTVQHSQSIGSSVLHIQVPSESVDARHILDSEGFSVVKTYWHMRWEGDESPPLELPPEFALRPFVLGQDEEALTHLQNAAFGQNWGFCPNTVEEISARVRFNRCDPEGIILIVHQGRPAAYNWTLRAANNTGSTGWIGMTGVHPDYRGRRIGRAVVVAGMAYLQAKGVDEIELEVDADNVPARELYLKLGFRVVHKSVWYERGLKA